MVSSTRRAEPRAPTAPAGVSADDPQWVVTAYRTHARDLWALIGRLGVPPASIEDVIQEVFLVLHRRRHEFRHESSLRTWLHGIAINLARRERMRSRRSPPREHDGESPEPRPSPESIASTNQALVRLDRLLCVLSDEQREVFVLAEIAELAAPEIAEATGVTLNTVYSRLRLGRAHVQRALERLRAEGAIDATP